MDLVTLNLPQTIRAEMFPVLSVELVLSAISIVVIISAVIAIYQQYYLGNSGKINILFSMTMTFLVLMYTKLLEFGTGIIMLSVVLLCIAAMAFESLDKYIKKTYLARLRIPVFLFVSLLLLLTIAVPSFFYAYHGQDLVTESEHDAFVWINEFSKQEAVVFTSPDVGQAAAYLSERRVFFDNMFLGLPKLDELNTDIIKSARMDYGLESLQLFTNVTYMIDSPRMTVYLGERLELDKEFDCMNEVQQIGSKEDLSYARVIFNRCKLS
jgi:small-conductance mechanosensitive channel